MNVTLYEYEIAPAFNGVDDDSSGRLYRAMRDLPWFGGAPDRFGFVRPMVYSTYVVYGLFAQQYRRDVLDYDDQKREIASTDDDFEHYLFVVMLDRSRILLQRRKIQEDTFPGAPVVLDRFTDLLMVATNSVGLSGGFSVAEIMDGYSRDQFLQAFNDSQNRITYMTVSDFDDALLPDDFHFFNPNFELNEAYGRGARKTFAESSEVSMRASKGGDLSRAPDARGYIQAASNPKALRLINRQTGEETMMQSKSDRYESCQVWNFPCGAHRSRGRGAGRPPVAAG